MARRSIGTAALAAAGALTLAALTGCASGGDGGGGGGTASGTLAQMQESGTARTAWGGNLPFSMITASGQAEGMGVDFSNEVTQALGVDKVEGTVVEFSAMIPGLQAKQFDFLAGGLNITEERCEQVIFSLPLTLMQDSFGVPTGNPKDITSYEGLVGRDDVTIAVISGSSQHNYAKQVGIAEDRLLPVPDTASLLAALDANRADGFAVSEISAAGLRDQGGTFDIVVDRDSPAASQGIAFRKEDTELRDAFNAELMKMREDGRYLEIYERWGFTTWEQVQKLTDASQLFPNCE